MTIMTRDIKLSGVFAMCLRKRADNRGSIRHSNDSMLLELFTNKPISLPYFAAEGSA